MPPFRAAVFDMDGLLLDSERPVRDAWLQAAAEHQVALSVADYLTVVGRNERDSRVRLLELFGDDAELLGAVRRRADGLLAERFGAAPFPVKPGAQRLLQALNDAKIPCAVASSTAHDEVHRRLERAGLRRHFAAICGGDEVAHGKPAPDLYQLAIRRLEADAARSVAFEDSNYGARAAMAAGLAVVVVPDLKPPEPAWQAHCLATLESLDDAYRQRAAWFGIVEQT
ncbi:MAG TPA: HAD family phosphatase [Burkholderiaceae bacterium]